jgi:ubiquinone/menaquinone biosynthesis C-methylase UbiE
VGDVSGWDKGYRRLRASGSHAALMGHGFPPAVQPFSFVPLDGLRSVLGALSLRAGQTLIDLGCGRGGPGLWLAEQAGARLVGIDASGVAVADARRRAELFPAAPVARFDVADVTATELPDGLGDAVVSIDVLQLVDDQAAMLREAARLLRPGGRLVLTTWEGFGDAPARFPRELTEIIAGAGLDTETVTAQPAWTERQYEIYARAATAEAGGDPAMAALAEEGRRALTWRHAVRRLLVVARRRGHPGPT